MRSTFARILLWMAATVVLSAILMTATSWVLARTIRRDDPFARSLSLQMDVLRRAYESGGPEELGKQLQRIEEFFPGERYLVDSSGRDLQSGQDFSALMKKARRVGTEPRMFGAGAPLLYSSRDQKYHYLLMPRLRPSMWGTAPYFLWIVIAVAVLSWVFTRSLVRPLNELRSTVDRFGRGELAARTHSTRRDEFGDVSRSFDDMANRIETLLTAERRLLQDISHELRTPLSRLGFAIELARTAPDKETSLARIRKEADRLSHLVGQLLQVTRAEGDPATREMEDVDIDRLLKEVAEDSAMEAELRHVRIISRIEDHTVIRGDVELLRRAIENIVRNAIRHAPEGTAIEIRLEKEPGSALIKVRDQGPGVKEEHLAEIFKPFFREDSSRAASTGGLGLGLAIAYRAIHLHHGKVRAENVYPGLMVEIELPVAA